MCCTVCNYVKYIWGTSTGTWWGRGLLEPGFWPRAELRPKGEDRRAAGQGGVPHLGEVADQESMEGGHGTRQCASEMVRSSYDYSNTKIAKDKARAFHTCKMSLARQVFAYFSLIPKPPFRFNGCATLQLSRAQGNFCIVTLEVACQRLGPIYIILFVNVKLLSGMITCCFDEHQCVKDWVEMQEHALDVARLVWTTKMSL